MANEGKEFQLKTGHIVTIILMMITLWLFSGICISYLSPKIEYRGIIGDMFGAVNALFSGLALCGIILSIYLQNRELRAQQEEFKKQNFENTLFKMIELIRENRSEITYNYKSEPNNNQSQEKQTTEFKTIKGSEAIAYYYYEHRNNLKNLGDLKSEEELKNNINTFYTPLSNKLYAYHSTIRRTMYYILSSNLEDKSIYEEILSSQFTMSEKLLFIDSELINDDPFLKLVIYSQRFAEEFREPQYFTSNLHFQYFRKIFH